ncbi:glycosyltransferase family 4 protein [Leptolyngbya sp. NIES-2104]|uniref:glycosyltransferase family 4 protein n=1 Tax=Leptolyngbya sp. NIES-2104 TaxID=1552121 RepID=UPI0006EC6CCC|nr:glycosyltransferase family 4 protein [Leptolyngbya sp. NIES-2104]GAP96998.1 glycosyl transferase, group 1 [Leptolyngbya sp. NIES-2104]
MQKPVLTIFYQFNPWRSSIGGIQTIIRSFVKYAPDEFEICFVGTGADPAEKPLQWQEREYAGKQIQFMPLFTLQGDNHRKRVPISVGYTAALFRTCLESDFMHFHRIEPTLATRSWRGEKTLFVHNDIRQQTAKTDKRASLWRNFPAVYSLLERSLVKQFDQILSCHTGSLELYRDRYPELSDRISYINNSFDDAVFQPSSDRIIQRRLFAQKLGLSEDTQFILFAGRLQPQKDPVLLIQAIAALAHPNAHLLIAGDGELATEIKAEATRLEVRDRITLLGAQTQPEMAHLYQIANVFVLSSRFEGLPVSVLEALGSGTPIVTTDCGDTPRLLTLNSGIVCLDRLPTTIADALDRVLFNPDDFPSDACVRTVQPYSARVIVSQVYREMMARWEVRSHKRVMLSEARSYT